MNKVPAFTFYAHRYRKNGPKANNDTDIILNIDQDSAKALLPFGLLRADSRLKVTIEEVTE